MGVHVRSFVRSVDFERGHCAMIDHCTHPGAQRHTDGSLTCLMCRAPVALRGGADEPWRLETRYPTNLDTPAPARAERLAVSP